MTESGLENKSEAALCTETGYDAADMLRGSCTSFDDLDIGSTFFEQYLIQDARSGAKAADVLGGGEALRNFQQLLRENGHLIAHIVCRASDPEPIAMMDSSQLWGAESDATTFEVSLNSESDQKKRLPEQLRTAREFLEADLVWFTVPGFSETDETGIYASILGEILELRRSVSPESAEQPILIVSSLRGSPRKVALPFVGGCEESLIHVPLWIDEGKCHARRLQNLAGSFDLLPTLAEYLTGTTSKERFENHSHLATPGEKGGESQETFSLAIGPKSLWPLLTGFDNGGDRLLRLVGDGWTALRSQQYLLVSAEVNDHDSETINSELDRRRLYLKPDDFWNVNNSIVTYEAVADEMDSAWHQHGA